MTNKEYKDARDIAENVSELYTFEKWNGYSFYPSRYMDGDDARELRAEYKQDARERHAEKLNGANGRAVIIPIDGGELLKSYYTPVCKIENGVFFKMWAGFSVTTLKHVNAFRARHGLTALSKREWIEL